MISLNYILRNFTGGDKFTKSQENINSLMYMKVISLFAKKELETDTNNKNIQPGYKNGIGLKKCAMLIMKSGKRQIKE